MHEIKVQEGVAPPVKLDLRAHNRKALKTFCDTPGDSWDPYEVAGCKYSCSMVYERYTHYWLAWLDGLPYMCSLGHFLPTSLV